ncbi:hypothetical protein V502_04451 [Pseudogymnoascus sp. VKM F-4520 (FW-2644)]|nr:hypothetical protein V502_04451 [Pseudogymnoascus sp. VKM F-4520 (FW-2644)]
MQAGEEGDAYAAIIDGVYGSVSSNLQFSGARKYLSTKRSLEHGDFACRDRVAVLEHFLAAMEQRMGDTPNPDQRMVRPLSEVGYSCHPVTRLKAHHEQHSSNFIMGLCMAVLEEEVPHTGFQLSQHVVVRIYELQDVALGEAFVTALMQAYTVNGGGFSHEVAGTYIERRKLPASSLFGDGARLKKEANTSRQDIASCLSEIAEEKKKQEAMWEEIERTAPEVQKSAEAEIDVIKRMRDVFL